MTSAAAVTSAAGMSSAAITKERTADGLEQPADSVV